MDEDIIFVEGAPVDFDLPAISRKLRLQPGTGEAAETLERLGLLAEQAAAVARPRAAARLCAVSTSGDDQVLVAGVSFTSTLLHEKLAERGRAFPYLATEGVELADWHRSLSSSLDQRIAPALREAAVKRVEEQVERAIMERYGIRQVSAMNPGSLALWPIAQQAPLFQLLAPLPERLSVGLLPSLMMEPAYSISGIFFQTDTKYYNCQLCPRPACPNRKAPSTVV